VKIGIITLPLHTNYGGILQNFALQHILKQEGHEVYTINIVPRVSFLGQVKKMLSRLKRKFLNGNRELSIFHTTPNSNEELIIRQHTNSFIKMHISLFGEFSYQDLPNLRDADFDAIIVGSDQVWRKSYVPNIQDYFLNFLGDDNRVKRIAYSASFGLDNWQLSSKMTRKCKVLAKKFNSISVREVAAVRVCETHLGVKVSQALDPTLLLNKNAYLDLINTVPMRAGENVSQSTPSLMSYILDDDSTKTCFVQQIAERLKLRINAVGPEMKFSNESRKTIEKCVYPPVEHWLRGFFESDFVVTDSFHGTVFAIIFEKQFIAIGNKDRGLSRFDSLLKIFNLESRLVLSTGADIEKILDQRIDYGDVNQILIEKKMASIDFLMNSLYA